MTMILTAPADIARAVATITTKRTEAVPLVGVTAAEYATHKGMSVEAARDELFNAKNRGVLRMEKQPRLKRTGEWQKVWVFLPTKRQGTSV